MLELGLMRDSWGEKGVQAFGFACSVFGGRD